MTVASTTTYVGGAAVYGTPGCSKIRAERQRVKITMHVPRGWDGYIFRDVCGDIASEIEIIFDERCLVA